MVFLNLSEKAVEVPWERFAEITAGLGVGRNPLSGATLKAGGPITVKAGDPLTVGAGESLVLQFDRQ
jgi:hypothetical protein